MVKNEIFQIWPCYVSFDCKFCVLSEKQKNCVLKIKQKLPQSKKKLPCLGTFLSPCLTTSIPVRNLDGRLIDRDFKIPHHLFRYPLPCNDWLFIAQLFRWLHISNFIYKETPPLSKLWQARFQINILLNSICLHMFVSKKLK